MKPPQTPLTSLIFSVACLLALPFHHRALSETKPQRNAQDLLEEARKNESDRRIAAKQTVAIRLNEDIKKAKQQTDDLDKSISKVTSAAAETTDRLDKLAAEKKRFTQELELTNLRLEAEKLKAEGLKLLGIAHAKGRDALEKSIQETDLKLATVTQEVTRLESSQADPVATGAKAKSSKRKEGTPDTRKQLLKAEAATAAATSSARVAMEAASARLKQADAAIARMEKKEAELDLEKNPSLPGGNDPLKPNNK